jgi:DNA-binding response OmpR family regulator
MHILQLDSNDPRAGELLALIQKGNFNIDVRKSDLSLNLDPQTLTVLRDGHSITLTKKEFALLSLLFSNKESAVSRETIIHDVWGMTIDPFSNTIEAHIRSLRKKLGGPNIIHTVPRVGYKLAASA